MPSSASGARPSGLVIVNQPRAGNCAASAPSPLGPRMAPVIRKPSTVLIFRRWKSGTAMAAVARTTITSR